jgi:hypothetical protein
MMNQEPVCGSWLFEKVIGSLALPRRQGAPIRDEPKDPRHEVLIPLSHGSGFS